MKNFLPIFLIAFAYGCAATQSSNGPPVIVADGTEMEQFENLVFCGDRDKFAITLGKVGSKLNDSWNAVLGEENTQSCEIRIRVNPEGNIIDHSVIECDNTEYLKEILAEASPVPIPNDQCLMNAINGVKYVINSGDKDS